MVAMDNDPKDSPTAGLDFSKTNCFLLAVIDVQFLRSPHFKPHSSTVTATSVFHFLHPLVLRTPHMGSRWGVGLRPSAGRGKPMRSRNVTAPCGHAHKLKVKYYCSSLLAGNRAIVLGPALQDEQLHSAGDLSREQRPSVRWLEPGSR